jgi:hypothetical protein
MTIFLKNLYRKNNELLVAIKKQSSDGKIPKGLLVNGSPAMRTALQEFQLSRYLDKPNEKYPSSSKQHPTPINRAFYMGKGD